MKRFATIALGMSLLWASGASATTVVSEDPVFQEWVDAATLPTPPIQVRVVVGDTAVPCGSRVLGCAEYKDATVYLLAPLRKTFLHELGHLYDHFFMSPDERVRFAGILERPLSDPATDSVEWFQGHLAEDWASAYSLALRKTHVRRGWVGGPPALEWRQLRAIRHLIRVSSP